MMITEDSSPRFQKNSPHSLIPLKHPFTFIINGKHGRGKSTVIINLLLREEFYKGYFDEIHIFCPSVYEDQKWTLIKLPEECIHTTYEDKEIDGLIAIKEENNHLRSLFIFDDCGSENIRHIGHNNPWDRLMMRCRHLNVSQFILSQQFTSLSTPSRHNADGVIQFSTTNGDELEIIRVEFGGGDRIAKEYYRTAVRDEDFLFIHMQTPTAYFFKGFHTLLGQALRDELENQEEEEAEEEEE